jgi:hypothetical protein
MSEVSEVAPTHCLPYGQGSHEVWHSAQAIKTGKDVEGNWRTVRQCALTGHQRRQIPLIENWFDACPGVV